jgi:ADP-ribose pyrophosphatase
MIPGIIMPVPLPANAKQVFKNRRHEIWEWDQELYDGTHATFSATVREDTVGVIAFLDADTILLQYEEQKGTEEPFWDVPGGIIDHGESPEHGAARELLEETGYRASTLRHFRTKRFTGLSRFEDFVYLAAGLSNGEPIKHDAGEKITLKPTSWHEAVRLSLQGGLRRQDVMLAILAMEFDPDARAIKQQLLAS